MILLSSPLSLGSETVPGNRDPAPLGPPDRRARRKGFEDSHRPLKGEQVPAVCLFDDVHEMWEERRLVWQPPQNCPSKLVEDKVRAVKPRNDGAGVEEKLKRKPRPTIASNPCAISRWRASVAASRSRNTPLPIRRRAGDVD